MSKKLGLILLLSTALLFAGFIVGLLVGKNTNDTEIIFSNVETQSATDLNEETTSQKIVDLGLININTASVDELMELPGIGEVIAQRIVDYREANGDFSDIEDLMKVSGIGETRIHSISEYITVGG